MPLRASVPMAHRSAAKTYKALSRALSMMALAVKLRVVTVQCGTQTHYRLLTGPPPAGAHYGIYRLSAGGGESMEFFDILGRGIRSGRSWL